MSLRATALFVALGFFCCSGTFDVEELAPAIVAPDTVVGVVRPDGLPGVVCVFRAELRGQVEWLNGVLEVHTREIGPIQLPLDSHALASLPTEGILATMPYPFVADMTLQWRDPRRSLSRGFTRHRFHCVGGAL